MDKVNLKDKLAEFDECWRHRRVGRVNNIDIKLVKLEGPFEWHSHDVEDELFYVVEGRLIMHFRDKDVEVLPGEFIIVPHTVEHMPEAPVKTHIMLIEPSETVNTGNNAPSDFTHNPVDA